MDPEDTVSGGSGLALIAINTLALGLVSIVVAMLLNASYESSSLKQHQQQWWLRSRYSKYRCLVLPPSCRAPLRKKGSIARNLSRMRGKTIAVDTIGSKSTHNLLATYRAEAETEAAQPGTAPRESTVKFNGTDGGSSSSPTFKKAVQRRRSGGNLETAVKEDVGDVFIDPEEQYEFKDVGDDRTPVLVFVNKGSGGNQGKALLNSLKEFLNPMQVVDLSNGGPEEALRVFMQHVPSLRLLICGGDGTVGWVLNVLDQLRDEPDFKALTLKSPHPPVAVLPLGTGNDLARVLGWGGGYSGEELEEVLETITHAYPVYLDRWNVQLSPLAEPSPPSTPWNEATTDNSTNTSSGGATETDGGSPAQPSSPTKSPKLETTKSKSAPWLSLGTPSKPKPRPKITFPNKEPKLTFNNYFSIGVDASAASRFHNLRNRQPHLFVSRFLNKVWYAVLGANEIMKPSCKDLEERVTLFADGEVLKLPEGTEGVIFLNIKSYSGGVELWQDVPEGEEDEAFVGTTGAVESTFELPPGFNEKGAASVLVGGMNHPELIRVVSGTESSAQAAHSQMDGMLDVLAVKGIAQLGQVRFGLSHLTKLCQCRRVKVEINKHVPVQFDGEPWLQQPSLLDIHCRERQAEMLQRVVSADDQAATEMNDLLDWATRNQITTTSQRTLIAQELSRRMEAKRRQRATSEGERGVTKANSAAERMSHV